MNLLKYLSTIIILSIAQGVTAQGNQLCDSIIVEDANGIQTKKSLFTYDAKGRLLTEEKLVYNKKVQKWAGLSYEEWSYDAAGNCTHNVVKHWNSAYSDWQPASDKFCRYDSKGRITELDIRKWSAQRSVWIGEQKTTTEYDAQGRQQSVVSFDWDEKQQEWEMAQRTQYEYNTQGNITKITESIRSGAVWQLNHREVVTYDKAGKVKIGDLKSLYSDGQWIDYERNEYSLKVDGNHTFEVVSKQMKGANGEWQNSERLTNEFDEHHTLIANSEETWHIDKWLKINQERSVVKYDERGNKTADSHYRWAGYDANHKDVWMDVSNITEKYDDKGNVLSVIRLVWDERSNKWLGVENVESTYYPSGKVQKRINRIWNAQSGEWENITNNAYEYDEKGSVVRETTAQWNAAAQEWKTFFEGKNEYSYDNGAVKRIEEFVLNAGEWKRVAVTTYY